MPLFKSLLSSSGAGLEPFRSSGLAHSHPLRRLFESSRQRGFHANGSRALSDVAVFPRSIERELGVRRIGEHEMRARVRSVMQWSRDVLTALPEADGVVWFGSSIRGKPEPGDIDVCIVTHGESVERHEAAEKDGSQCRCRRLEAAFEVHRNAVEVPRDFPPVSAKVVAWYDEHPFLRLCFVERCPYLVLARSAAGLQGFSNVGGRDYLEAKSP